MYVLVAFSRPEQLHNVIKNFEQQSYAEKKLIIVENGQAIGTCKRHGFAPDALLSSDNHQSWAKNEGLQYIRSHGGGWWTTFDDDDYYGPEYLTKVSKSLGRGEIIGQQNLFIRTIAGTVREFSGLDVGSCEGVHGSTITARAEDCPDFEDTGPWGEDWDFINRYRAEGAACWSTDSSCHMLVRHAKNTWQIQDDSMVRRFAFASGGKCIVKDYGPESKQTIHIVNGNASNEFEVVESDGELRLEDSQAYVELMKKVKPIEGVAEDLLTGLRGL